MKRKSLQLKRALSAALFVLLLSVAGTKNALAQKLVAVLQHNDTISAFYGANALVEAYNAAANGDTITLSSGSFNPTNISKAITLHGAGMVGDTLGVTRTRIGGGFIINLENNPGYFTAEGIYFDGNLDYQHVNRAVFNKCYIPYIGPYYINCYYLFDVVFYNCLIGGARIQSGNDGVLFYNCVINSFINYYYCNPSNPGVYAYNCIIQPTNDDQYHLSLYNCIISGSYVDRIKGQYADHCIMIGGTFPSSVTTYECTNVTSYDDVFETWDGTFGINADYSLKEEAASTYLGYDGTQVGIFGGIMPFKTRPVYLRPYRFHVPPYTTPDGHLNVEVEVAPEE